ncbi:MAG: DNA repair protein RecO [candidate division KSB1 bacterium]|nr:DNA repair protein RecO [candidate division KSB1 bacterium]
MAIEKGEGIVLRVRPQGETSKLVYLYTESLGRLAFLAKGARLPKSKFAGSLDTGNRIAVVYYSRERRELNYLSHAEILERFPRVQTDISRLAIAEQAFEILLQFGTAGEASPRIYRLLLDLLRGLERADRGFRSIGRSFLLHFLEVAGFRPNLESCSACGAGTVGETAVFEIDRGGYVCSNCRARSAMALTVLGRTVEWARWLLAVPPSKAAVPLHRTVGEELDRWLGMYLSYHMEGAEQLSTLRYREKFTQAPAQKRDGSVGDGKEEQD